MIHYSIESSNREDMEALQLKRLQEMVLRIYSLVPFYKDSLDQAGVHPGDIKNLADLQKLPFTKKQDLRDHYPFGLFTVPKEQLVRIHSSSGTTGKPTVVGYTEHDMKVWNEVMMRVYLQAEVSAKDVIHNAYGYGLFTGGLGFHSSAEALGATVVPSGGGFTSRQVMLLKDFGATVLTCTPTFALHLAEVAQKEGYDLKKDFKLKAGIFGAEPVSRELKDEIIKQWGIRYHDVYGLSEIIGPGVSSSCCHSDTMHIMEDHFLPEVVHPVSGETLPNGEQGELVFTTVTKQAIPLLRYRTGDLTVLHSEPCKCGRNTIQMESILGRTDDMLIVNGVNVFPSQVEHVLAQHKGSSLNYVIIADKKGFMDKLDIQMETDNINLFNDEKARSKLKNNIEKDLLNNLYVNAQIELVQPEVLERSMGKAVRVIDKRKTV